jgi:phage I-like protein
MKKHLFLSVGFEEKPENGWNQIARTIRTKAFEVSAENISEMIRNFNANVTKREDGKIPVYPTHPTITKEERKAVGWMQEVREVKGEDGNTYLEAKIEWTEKGKELIGEGSFKFISAEMNTEYTDEETSETKGWVLEGASLTNDPRIPGMKKLMLSKNHENISFYSFSPTTMPVIETILSFLEGKETLTPEEYALLETAFGALDDAEKEGVQEKVTALKEKVAQIEASKTAPSSDEEKKKLMASKTAEKMLLQELAVSNSRIEELEKAQRSTEYEKNLLLLSNEAKILPKEVETFKTLLLSMNDEGAKLFLSTLGARPAQLNLSKIGGTGTPVTGNETAKKFYMSKMGMTEEEADVAVKAIES